MAPWFLPHGTQAAYAAIINRWQSHRGATNWIHFDNVGHWGENYLDRAALTEYIQVGNDRKAASTQMHSSTRADCRSTAAASRTPSNSHRTRCPTTSASGR